MDKLQLVAAHNGWVSSICRSDASPSQEMLPLPCQVATCQKLIQPSPNQLFPPNLNPDFHMFELQILQTWTWSKTIFGTIRTTRNYYLLSPWNHLRNFRDLNPALRIPDVFSIFHESTTLSDGGLHGALPFGALAVVGVSPKSCRVNPTKNTFMFHRPANSTETSIFKARVSKNTYHTTSWNCVFPSLNIPVAKLGEGGKALRVSIPAKANLKALAMRKRYVKPMVDGPRRLAGGWLSQSRRILVALLVTTPFRRTS